MAAATSYSTHAMARPAAGQWVLLAPKAPSPLLSVSLRGGVCLPSCAVSFSGSLTPASAAHGIARLIACACSTGSQNSNAGAERFSDEGNNEPNHETANLIMRHSKLICCKLYISEKLNISGRCNNDTEAIDAIDKAARSDPNKVVVLSKFEDCIYNRVRYTLVSYISKSSKAHYIISGDNKSVSVSTLEVISPIRDVLLKMVETAFAKIKNLKGHSGTHPRMGVIDDLSFHPLGDANMEDAACLARLVASDISADDGCRYKVPVFLYGEAHPERKTLGAIRRELGYYVTDYYFSSNSNSDEELLKILKETKPDNDIVKKISDEVPLKILLKEIKPDNDIVKKENGNTTDLSNTDLRGATTVGAAPFLEGYNVPLRCKDDIKKVSRIVNKLRKQLGGGREGLPKFLAKELLHGECIEIGCLFDANHLRADQIQDMVRQIAAEQGLEDKVEKGYYTDITKEMILVNLQNKLNI